MKYKMQIMLSATVIILVLIGSAVFIFYSYNFLLRELQKQVVQDNEVIGEQLLKLFADLRLHEEPHERQVEILQNICDGVKLPNDGFICATNSEGILIAQPGIDPQNLGTFVGSKFFDLNKQNEQLFIEYPPDQRFTGLLQHHGDRVDIVAAVPIENTDIRMFVHQNMDKLKARTISFIKPLIFAGIIVSVILGLVTYLFANRIVQRYESKLGKAYTVLEMEKQKTDALLLNILPEKVANDLKETGKTKPKSFENVTVYFSDIVNFTQISEALPPEILIAELNEIFTAFDNIIEKHHCERIKTIGDAYLAVCGMPEKDPNHAENILNAAIEMNNYLQRRNEDSKIQWEVRAGIHSGKVVGGVVGIKKYIYDVFGDTINTASRMQSNSEPMKINISETTYDIVKKSDITEEKTTLTFQKRTQIEVKGKGKMMMYFVNG